MIEKLYKCCICEKLFTSHIVTVTAKSRKNNRGRIAWGRDAVCPDCQKQDKGGAEKGERGMRDRLIELFYKINYQVRENGLMANLATQFTDYAIEQIVDKLLAEGVIVPPVKVGQICYKVYMGEILEIKVTSISYEPLPAFAYTIRFNSLGVLCLMADGTRNDQYSWLIFLTREEAERALERSENGT